MISYERIESLQNNGKKINAVIVQPNIDPNKKWHEKEKIISFMDSLHQEATKMNPDIKDYVTRKALTGVFKMITIEEKKIRTDFAERTSDLLKRVFALQDKI